MVNVTFSVPEKAHKIMKQHPEIRWTEIARKPVLGLVESIEKQGFDVGEFVRNERQKEQGRLMKKAGGDAEKALKLWAEEHRKELKKARKPNWWNNAAGSL